MRSRKVISCDGQTMVWRSCGHFMLREMSAHRRRRCINSLRQTLGPRRKFPPRYCLFWPQDPSWQNAIHTVKRSPRRIVPANKVHPLVVLTAPSPLTSFTAAALLLFPTPRRGPARGVGQNSEWTRILDRPILFRISALPAPSHTQALMIMPSLRVRSLNDHTINGRFMWRIQRFFPEILRTTLQGNSR